MERINALSQASLHMKAPGVGAREFTSRSPCGKTPARSSQAGTMLKIAFGWTLYFCAVSLANASDQLDVNAVHREAGKQGDPNIHGAPDDLRERLQTADGEELPEPSQDELLKHVPSARLNLTAHAVKMRAVPSTAGGERLFEQAFAEVPEDLPLDLTSTSTSSSCGGTKCSEEISQGELKLLTAEADAGGPTASHTASSFSFTSKDGEGDSVLSSGDVIGTHLPGISQADEENANTLVQAQPKVSGTVLPAPVYTPKQFLSAGATSDAAPYTRLDCERAEPPSYEEVLRRTMLVDRLPRYMSNMDLYDSVPVRPRRSFPPAQLCDRRQVVREVVEKVLGCLLVLLLVKGIVALVKYASK